MIRIAISDPKEALNFLKKVNLPMLESEFESVSRGPVPAIPEYLSGKEQAVAIGSQIAEFAAEVPLEIRSQVSNSFLLAQLAANRVIQDNNGKTEDWYNRYVEVLANIGWIVESNHDALTELSGSSAEVHKEIIPVLTAALGPTVAAAAMVIAVLKGLEAMDNDQPWITLFDRESQRASTNQFQISYAAVDENKAPLITLVCFELDASRSLTQVLFFKFSNTEAKLRQFGAKLGINTTVFKSTAVLVENRIADYISDYIKEIPI